MHTELYSGGCFEVAVRSQKINMDGKCTQRATAMAEAGQMGQRVEQRLQLRNFQQEGMGKRP